MQKWDGRSVEDWCGHCIAILLYWRNSVSPVVITFRWPCVRTELIRNVYLICRIQAYVYEMSLRLPQASLRTPLLQKYSCPSLILRFIHCVINPLSTRISLSFFPFCFPSLFMFFSVVYLTLCPAFLLFLYLFVFTPFFVLVNVTMVCFCHSRRAIIYQI